MATKKTVVKGKKEAEKTTKKAPAAKKTAQVTAKKTAPKKAAPAKTAKPAPKKAVAKKPEVKKPVVKKAAPVKAAKPVAKKAVAKKAAPAKVVKSAPKKAAPAKVAKPAAKKAVVKKATPAKVVKPTPKKAVAKKPEVKKPAVKKAAPVKVVAKPAPKKAPVKPAAPVKAVAAKPVATKAATPKVKAAKPVGIAKKIKKEAQPLKEVKVPKIATTAKKSYNPSYTPMEQRETDVNQEPLVRYSEEELQEFKDLIIKKLADAKREVTYLQGIITRKDDMGGDIESRYMTMEDGTVSMEREQLSQMASRQIAYIDNLEKALIRIENKTYGICRVTGKLIDKARLRAVPHATLSIEAKLNRRNNSEQ